MSKINGQDFIITPGSFEEAMRLKDAVSKAITRQGIRLDLSGLDGGDIMNTPVEKVGGIIENVLAVDSDPEVRVALFSCAARATYGKDREKITVDFFEPVERRELYYPIMVEVLKVNLGPFFKNLLSKFETLDVAKAFGNLKSK